MKKTKVLILGIVCLLAFDACNDDDDTMHNVPNEKESEFIGDFTVGNNFELNGIESELEFDFVKNTVDFEIDSVRFSPNMPICVDMDFEDMNFSISGTDTIISYDSIIPFVGDMQSSAFTMYNFRLVCRADSLILNCACYAMDHSVEGLVPIVYKAKRANH